MKEKPPTRSVWIKLRVTPAEKEAILAKAVAQGQTVTDFIRQRALDYRLRQTPLEKERVRQLARIGANLNQLARWVNIHKEKAEAVQVLAALLHIEQLLGTSHPHNNVTNNGGVWGASCPTAGPGAEPQDTIKDSICT